MITALLSALVGLASGAAPEILKEWRYSRDHEREKEFLLLQNELQMKRLQAGLEGKIQQQDNELLIEEMRYMREHVSAIVEAQARPTGIAWIDGFNAVLRPIVCMMIILLFMFTACWFVAGVLSQFMAGDIKPDVMAQIIWASLIGESIQAVLGFLFGYRSARKRVEAS